MIQRVTAGDRDLLADRDSIVRAYRGQLLLGTGAADKAGIKALQELAHALGVVAPRVDGHVDDLHLIARRIELPACRGQYAQGDRAHRRTRGVAEGERHHLATVMTECQFAAVGAAQREVRRQARGAEYSGNEVGIARGTDGSATKKQRQQCNEWTSHAWSPDLQCNRRRLGDPG